MNDDRGWVQSLSNRGRPHDALQPRRPSLQHDQSQVIDVVFNMERHDYARNNTFFTPPSPVLLSTCSLRASLICHSLPSFASGGPRFIRCEHLHAIKMRASIDDLHTPTCELLSIGKLNFSRKRILSEYSDSPRNLRTPSYEFNYYFDGNIKLST